MMRISIFILFLFVAQVVFAQKTDEEFIETMINGTPVIGKIVDGDTIYFATLEEHVVVAKRTYQARKRAISYARLKYYVRKVYPYVRLAVQKIELYDEIIANTEKDREKKKLMRAAEKELKNEFSDHIRNLTRIQGEIFIKLIHRETGMTVHEILKKYRGGWTAASWQTVAVMFGEDLKDTYKPETSDELIEELVLKIENGKLRPLSIPEKVLTKEELRDKRRAIRKKMRAKKKKKKEESSE